VLLGTKSFWQGVDIPGRGVGCVFIDKLPLEPASRPLVASREGRRIPLPIDPTGPWGRERWPIS